MRKFKPLDLSFINGAGSTDFRNVAAYINAHAGWSTPSQIKSKDTPEASQSRPTFIQGLFDALSTPLYSVANALDSAIAGHQDSDTDDPLTDAVKTTLGFGTGAIKGWGAGLRGATTMLDVIPGIDINDEWQIDPTDKTRFSDVAIRSQTGMSTKEALKPENWEKVKAELEKSKNPDPLKGQGLSLAQMLIPDDLDDPEARENYFRRQMVLGIGGDILGDPLNLLTFGAKGALTGKKAIEEGLDAARTGAGSEITSGLKSGVNAPITKGDDVFDKASEGITPATIVDIPKGAPFNVSVPKAVVPSKDMGFKGALPVPVREGPVEGLRIDSVAQKKLVTDIAKIAATNQPGWVYKAAELLQKHPGDFTETARALDMLAKMQKAKGTKLAAGPVAKLLAPKIAQDSRYVEEVKSANSIINNADPMALTSGPLKSKLRPHQIKQVDETIKKYTSQILGKARPAGTGEALHVAREQGRNARWSGPAQANMWNTLATNTPIKNPVKKYHAVAKMLQHVEDYFLSKGVIPYSAAKIDGSVEGLRLSQVAMAIGPEVLGKHPQLITKILAGDPKAIAQLTPSQATALETLKASEAMVAAPATAEAINITKTVADGIASKVQSAGRMKQEMANLPGMAEKATVQLGGGPVAANVAKEYMRKLVLNPGSVDGVIGANKSKTLAWLGGASHGIAKNPVDPKFVRNLGRAAYSASQLPPPAQLGKLAGAAARVKDGFGAMFNAAYGVRDLNPILRREQANALIVSARRGREFAKLAKVFPPSDVNLWHQAFKAAQSNGITAGQASELQKQISKIMESLFGGTGLRNTAIADSTVVGRSHLAMDELNEAMRRVGLKQQFVNAKTFKLADGSTRDFSKGIDWLKSWEVWNVEKPYEFLQKVQTAVEHTVRDTVMMQEIANRFGSLNRHGEVKYAINHPRLKGVYFNEEGARQGEQFIKMLKDINTPNSKALQHIDHVMSKIKAGLTIYIPAHHWTNIIGDTFMNWFAGVNDPRRYQQAINVMKSQSGRYDDIITWQQNLVGPEALQKAMARGHIGTEDLMNAGLQVSAPGNSVVTTMKNGTKVTADMIYTSALKQGILPSARVLEDVMTDVTNVLDKIALPGKYRGAVRSKVDTFSEIRDHIPRLAQYIDAISKHKGSFLTASEDAANAVRKWHPDGLDLTKFERQGMKRVFPFYSWTRKAIPLAIEAAITKPGKVMAYPKLMEALSAALVDDPTQKTAPYAFPADQVFPDWLRERGIAPVLGGSGDYISVNPSTPALDIFTLLGKPGHSAIEMLNPVAKIPLELGSGKTLGTGAPIENELDYIAKQIPGVSQAGRVTGAYGVSKTVAESDRQQLINLINILTGAKATDTGIYRKSGQFDVREYFKDRTTGNK